MFESSVLIDLIRSILETQQPNVTKFHTLTAVNRESVRIHARFEDSSCSSYYRFSPRHVHMSRSRDACPWRVRVRRVLGFHRVPTLPFSIFPTVSALFQVQV